MEFIIRIDDYVNIQPEKILDSYYNNELCEYLIVFDSVYDIIRFSERYGVISILAPEEEYDLPIVLISNG